MSEKKSSSIAWALVAITGSSIFFIIGSTMLAPEAISLSMLAGSFYLLILSKIIFDWDARQKRETTLSRIEQQLDWIAEKMAGRGFSE